MKALNRKDDPEEDSAKEAQAELENNLAQINVRFQNAQLHALFMNGDEEKDEDFYPSWWMCFRDSLPI